MSGPMRTWTTIAAAGCCVASSSVFGQPTATYEYTGKWEDITQINSDPSWPLAMHAVHMPNGAILAWYLDPSGVQGGRPAKTWDPARGVVAVATSLIKGCAGQVSLSDGRALVAGGLQLGAPYGDGVTAVRDTAIFDGNVWTDVPDMTHIRYYPTLTTLRNSKCLVSAGTTSSGSSSATY